MICARHILALVMIAAAVGQPFATWVSGQTQSALERARDRLVDQVLQPAGIEDPRVLNAIRTTPRHELIPRRLWPQAYEDMALPIGKEQTISSPFIVAHMTEVLETEPTDRVLEVGTGSGYQAAVLSPLVEAVYTIEIVPQLGETAQRNLERLGYENVHVRIGDGFKGWPEEAPFDKIIVTCSPESVPQPLVDQLKEGGRMVIPVGRRYQQTLMLMEKRDGELIEKSLEPTLFVPMTGAAESQRTVLPDPANPKVVGGDFDAPAESGHLKGWYYGRNFSRGEEDEDGFVRFENDLPGRSSHLLQGLGIDGQAVSQIELSCEVRTRNVIPGPDPHDFPALAISFYDSSRRELGKYWVGPFLGTRDWRSISKTLAVPEAAQEAIVRIGLFGATGTADFDRVKIKAKKR